MTTEELVKSILEENFCLSVEKIPECNSKTPDFYAFNETEKYLVEVKEKGNNPEVNAGREESFSNGQLYEIAQSIQPKTVLENIVRAGKRQISNFVEDQNTFRIVWIHCVGIAYQATKDQIISGLYGSETLVDWGIDGGFAGECYYFNDSQFFKYRNDIDAVVVSCRNSEAQICVNNHSPRYIEFKSSSLVETFNGGAIDPLQKEEKGLAFVVDAPIDRKNKDAVLDYLKEKHNTNKLMVMPMQHFEAHFSVPHE